MPQGIVGIDVGGTFTDLVYVKPDGEVLVEKVDAADRDPFESAVDALEKMGVNFKSLGRIVFGTTLGANLVIERKGALTGLLCTKGFRDILEHQRWHRRHQYDLRESRPAPVVTREFRLGVDERVASDGTVLVELSDTSMAEALQFFEEKGVESIAVAFLNSYVNPANEQKALELIQRRGKWRFVTLSSAVSPLLREWERTHTTVVNAYIQPAMARYLTDLTERVGRLSTSVEVSVMQSNGGVASIERCKEQPVRSMLSGPVGGVMGGLSTGLQVKAKDVVTLDMGGTSADISVIRDQEPELTRDGEIAYNMPLLVPMVKVNSIGAGGGSIAWVDRGRLLEVGPQSAGAIPGPACYNRGGVSPTVTDAQLLLGRLNPKGLLGGRMRVSKDRAIEAFQNKVCQPLSLDVMEAAVGTLKVANTHMSEAIRLLTTDRGLDPRWFILVAFGGAGPMHACEIASELGIRTVVVPPRPGLLSAIGLASAPVKTNAIVSINESVGDVDGRALAVTCRRLEEDCRKVLTRQGVPADAQRMMWFADVRYAEQTFEVTVAVPAEHKKDYVDPDLISQAFHEKHEQLYNYSMRSETPFLVNVEVVGVEERPGSTGVLSWGSKPRGAQAGPDPEERDVYLLGLGGSQTIPIISRDKVVCSKVYPGPCLVEQFDCTVLVTEEFDMQADEYSNLVLRRRD